MDRQRDGGRHRGRDPRAEGSAALAAPEERGAASAGLAAGGLERARAYAAKSRADNTVRSQRSCWGAFEVWCEHRGVSALPASPETLCAFVAALADAGRSAETIDRYLSVVSRAHELAGHPSPRRTEPVRLVRAGVRRTIGTAAKKAKDPIDTAALVRLCEVIRWPLDPRGRRDRALLTLGWFAALRRSELVALDVCDVRFVPEGLVVTVRKSKTDQEGEGREIGVPYAGDPAVCPVRNLRVWLDAAGWPTVGPLFCAMRTRRWLTARRLGPRQVARLVQSLARRAGLPGRYGGHSLRAGFCSSAAAAGKAERAIMAQTGHTSLKTLRRYIRKGSLFRDNAATGLL